MRLARALCALQITISVIYVIVAITSPDTSRDIVLVGLYLASLAISRYLLWRARHRRRKRAAQT